MAYSEQCAFYFFPPVVNFKSNNYEPVRSLPWSSSFYFPIKYWQVCLQTTGHFQQGVYYLVIVSDFGNSGVKKHSIWEASQNRYRQLGIFTRRYISLLSRFYLQTLAIIFYIFHRLRPHLCYKKGRRPYFCDYRAPVPWVHPSKGTNLSGRDIWVHAWAEHPRESERFA